MPMSSDARERSIPGIVIDLIGQFSTLLRQESRLARAEISENVNRAIVGVAMAAAAAVLLIPALVILLMAAVYGLRDHGPGARLVGAHRRRRGADRRRDRDADRHSEAQGHEPDPPQGPPSVPGRRGFGQASGRWRGGKDDEWLPASSLSAKPRPRARASRRPWRSCARASRPARSSTRRSTMRAMRAAAATGCATSAGSSPTIRCRCALMGAGLAWMMTAQRRASETKTARTGDGSVDTTEPDSINDRTAAMASHIDKTQANGKAQDEVRERRGIRRL